jgi:muramoyltetrapeptide carboxypeptidase
MTSHKSTIRIIFPSSIPRENILAQRVKELEAQGFKVLGDHPPPYPAWPYASQSIEWRSKALMDALLEDESQILLCARGGYGASDLLPHLDWQRLKTAKPKILVGFSDISALHAAFYTFLNWKSIHGPMPLTSQWSIEKQDVKQLLAMLKSGCKDGSIDLDQGFPANDAHINGKLFGGCLAVLTNLIGTPYFPAFDDTILFLEDIAENPGKIVRYLNQWVQSRSLRGVRAIVLGTFKDLGYDKGVPGLATELRKRIPLPFFVTTKLGHDGNNFPLLNGASCSINNLQLTWRNEGNHYVS